MRAIPDPARNGNRLPETEDAAMTVVMASTPRVGAIMVLHNSAEDVDGAVAALGDPTVFLVVVDNASADGSADRIDDRSRPGLQLVELDRNTGFAGGCNRGYASLPDEVRYVASMNPDVRPAPDCLARCVAVMEADPTVGAVAPLLTRADEVTGDSAGQVLKRGTLEVRDLGYGEPLSDHPLRPREVLAGCGALTVYRREALEAVAEEHGPWAEHYFCFWEDLELGWRLVNAGWKVVFEPTARAEHRRGAGAAEGRGPLRWRRPVHLEACILTNRWMTLIRHLHGADLAWRWSILLAWDLLALGLGTLRRPRLLVQVWRRLPLVWREVRRRPTRCRRRLAELPW
jgi:GT2 family glycosyltransferase